MQRTGGRLQVEAAQAAAHTSTSVLQGKQGDLVGNWPAKVALLPGVCRPCAQPLQPLQVCAAAVLPGGCRPCAQPLQPLQVCAAAVWVLAGGFWGLLGASGVLATDPAQHYHAATPAACRSARRTASCSPLKHQLASVRTQVGRRAAGKSRAASRRLPALCAVAALASLRMVCVCSGLGRQFERRPPPAPPPPVARYRRPLTLLRPAHPSSSASSTMDVTLDMLEPHDPLGKWGWWRQAGLVAAGSKPCALIASSPPL